MEVVRLRLRFHTPSAIKLRNLSVYLDKSPAECVRRSILFGKFIFTEMMSGSIFYTADKGDERAQTGPAIIPPPLYDKPVRLETELELSYWPSTIDALADLSIEAQVSIELVLSWCIDVIACFYDAADTTTLHLRRANGDHAIIGLPKA
jgi:hypothetical protein